MKKKENKEKNKKKEDSQRIKVLKKQLVDYKKSVKKMNIELDEKKNELNPTQFLKLSKILDERENTLKDLTEKAEEMQKQLYEDNKEINDLNNKIEMCRNFEMKLNEEMEKTKRNFEFKEKSNENLDKKKEKN